MSIVELVILRRFYWIQNLTHFPTVLTSHWILVSWFQFLIIFFLAYKKPLTWIKETDARFYPLKFRCTWHIKRDGGMLHSKKYVGDDKLWRLTYKVLRYQANTCSFKCLVLLRRCSSDTQKMIHSSSSSTRWLLTVTYRQTAYV